MKGVTQSRYAHAGFCLVRLVRGDVVDAEVLDADTEAYVLQRGMTQEQPAEIKAEVEREAAALYGTLLGLSGARRPVC